MMPGFEWTDESRHKWGFVATAPDARLVFTVNTTTPVPEVGAESRLQHQCCEPFAVSPPRVSAAKGPATWKPTWQDAHSASELRVNVSCAACLHTYLCKRCSAGHFGTAIVLHAPSQLQARQNPRIAVLWPVLGDAGV